ncbi:MAG: type VI secretion system contractile sheath large subunit [Ideonella sp.]|nr:type VI secretion system contractile sheath large subunit [Ideonella sp.]MBL0147850.1 type VI secretion system contractile sheath large subunit [Ideonella sp.]
MSDDFSPDFASIGQSAPSWSAKRPLRLAILGDFSAGAARGRLDTGAALAKRKPLKVEFDTIEQAMQRLQLSLTLPLGADQAPVTIELAELDAFHPDAIYSGVPLFAELAGLRKRLNNASQFAAAAAAVMAWAEGAGPSASRLARRAAARGAAPAVGSTRDDFARLTGRASTTAKSVSAVSDLLQRVVGPFVRPAASANKDQLIAAVDAGLSDAMRAVLHHADFQSSEALWRGVDFLLRRVETSHQLQVHLLDISAEEFAADLSRVTDLADSGLYKLLVEQPSQDADGGYTYIAGCYQFDATPPHAELLGRAAAVASHAGASLLTGIHTDPFADRKEPPHRLVRQAFAALRDQPAASFLGLFGPRFLLRHPYGKRSDPISAFAFEEFSREAGLRGMLWGHPALLALTVLAQPGATLAVNDLPFHHCVDEHGDSIALPCTDRLISTNVASLLRQVGINAVMAHKGEALVRFNGLEAMNGDGLAVAGATPKKAPSAARIALQARIQTQGDERGVGAASTLRKGAPVAAKADEPVNEPVDEPSNESVEDSQDEPAADSAAAAGQLPDDSVDETPAPSPESAAPQDELAALLASLEAPAADSAEPGAEPTIDAELADLLKSLG